MNVRISARALYDLDIIYAALFSGKHSAAADRFLEQSRQAVEFLSQNPQAGPHPHWATRHRSLRFWVISRTNYLIYYFADEQGISIERVLDGRRDVARIMELREDDPPDLEQ